MVSRSSRDCLGVSQALLSDTGKRYTTVTYKVSCTNRVRSPTPYLWSKNSNSPFIKQTKSTHHSQPWLLCTEQTGGSLAVLLLSACAQQSHVLTHSHTHPSTQARPRGICTPTLFCTEATLGSLQATQFLTKGRQAEASRPLKQQSGAHQKDQPREQPAARH